VGGCVQIRAAVRTQVLLRRSLSDLFTPSYVALPAAGDPVAYESMGGGGPARPVLGQPQAFQEGAKSLGDHAACGGREQEGQEQDDQAGGGTCQGTDRLVQSAWQRADVVPAFMTEPLAGEQRGE
jgi:hypothetical protein